MGYKTILVSEVAGVRTIRMNRPERRNAMTPEMQEELITAFAEAGLVTSCRVVVLAGGGGGVLCGAGFDGTAGDGGEGWRVRFDGMADGVARGCGAAGAVVSDAA